MEITITITDSKGNKSITVSRELGELSGIGVVNEIESRLTEVKTTLFPMLGEKLLEQHQKGLVGEKNKEEER